MACNGRCACGGVTHNVSIQPGFVNYCVVRGDGFADTVTIEEPPTPGADPVPADLSARTYTAQLRKAPNSTTITYTFDIDMTDAAAGSFTFSIPASVTEGLTGVYHYDIEQTVSSDPRTILSGTITFAPDTTR